MLTKMTYRFLNVMHILQDANFWLNNQAHRRGNLDRALQPGSAYMVNQRPMEEYVKGFVDKKEASPRSLPDKS
jgi:hypothetical protein